MSRTIALLTDFGTTDTYVGVMKGVVLGIMPELRFVDLTHAIQPQNVRQAAFTLLNSYPYFPPETIFLVVVDPGVGSERKPIAVRAGGYTFVAPDNGVLSHVLRELGVFQAVELTNAEYQLAASNTFHGRDIFAPAAAHLAAGVSLEAFGNPVGRPVMMPIPLMDVESQHIRSSVEYIDHFGSLVTCIGLLRWAAPDELTLTPRFGEADSLVLSADKVVVRVGDQEVTTIRQTYVDVEPGNALALVGSGGYLELAVNQGSFAAQFEAQIGDPVAMQIG